MRLLLSLSTLKTMLLLSWLLSAISPALADSQLTIAEAFNIKAINGTLYSQGFVNHDRQLKLRAGVNLIAIEYEEVFDSESADDFDIIKSDVFLLKVYLENNARYQQRFVKPHNATAAKKYAANPLFEIVKLDSNDSHVNNSKLTPLAYQLTALASNQSSFLKSATRLRQNATLNLSSTKPNLQRHNGDKALKGQPVTIQQGQSNATQMLHYWWLRATPDERDAFIKTVNEQD